MDGSAALTSMTALYDVAGQIRAALIELQAQVRVSMGSDHAQGR